MADLYGDEGATDRKNNLMEAFDTLLKKNFSPERTILAGFGFDDDISGPQGAQFIAKHLEDMMGKDSIELIVDEGGLGIQEVDGATFALPGLGERGKWNTLGGLFVDLSQDT
jgi:Gly-Xaa carboxypeptidase